MENNFVNEIYSRMVQQHIQCERSIDTSRNLSVFIIAGMMYFIFGFPETSSHLIAILGSVTVFVLQIFQSKQFGKNLLLTQNILSFEEKVLEQSASSINENELSKILKAKPVKFIYSFAATTYTDYILIFFTLDVCWFSKLYLFPYAAESWAEFFSRPAFGFLPGWFFFVFAGGFWLTYFSLALWYKITSNKKSSEL